MLPEPQLSCRGKASQTPCDGKVRQQEAGVWCLHSLTSRLAVDGYTPVARRSLHALPWRGQATSWPRVKDLRSACPQTLPCGTWRPARCCTAAACTRRAELRR